MSRGGVWPSVMNRSVSVGNLQRLRSLALSLIVVLSVLGFASCGNELPGRDSVEDLDEFNNPNKKLGLSLTLVSESEVRASWSHAYVSRSGYRLYRKLLDATEWIVVASLGRDDTQYRDIEVSAPHVYQYYLVATRLNRESPASDTVEIEVKETEPANLDPFADAGLDQTKEDEDNDGVETFTLDATGSIDPDGMIVSYAWNLPGGQVIEGATADVTLPVGLHQIILIVTDNNGAVSSDEVVIEITAYQPNLPPVAMAGDDFAIYDSNDDGSESVGLDGGGSHDPDGVIVHYEWRENSTVLAAEVRPMVALSVGVHLITLTVTDNEGASASDQIQVEIVELPNTPPRARAGADQSVRDSDDSGSELVQVDGSGSIDSDGSIVSYVWEEGGSELATGVNPTLDLSRGSHTVTLTVIDDEGATGTDSLLIVVRPPNQSPTADAGSDQSIVDNDQNGTE